MAYTAQDHIDTFLDTYPGCSTTQALKWLNEVDEVILAAIPLRKSRVDLSLVAGQAEYTYDETILKVWAVQYYGDANLSGIIAPTDTDRLDTEDPTYQMRSDGTPWRWFVQSDMDGGQIGFNPAPDKSTLRVNGASVATPCVISLTANHELEDGDLVRISEVGGTTTANGLFYAKATGYGANQFALYSDEDLATPVAGVGVYTSGGLVAGPGSPKVVLECSQRRVLLAGSPMPANNTIKALYADGMAARWAKVKDPANYERRNKWFQDSLAEQWTARMKTQATAKVEILGFRQRPNFRNRGIRR